MGKQTCNVQKLRRQVRRAVYFLRTTCFLEADTDRPLDALLGLSADTLGAGFFAEEPAFAGAAAAVGALGVDALIGPPLPDFFRAALLEGREVYSRKEMLVATQARAVMPCWVKGIFEAKGKKGRAAARATSIKESEEHRAMRA